MNEIKINQEKITVIISVFTGSFLIAHFTSKTVMSFTISFLIAFIIILSIYLFVLRSIIRANAKDPVTQKVKELQKRVQRLSFNEVKSRAEHILTDATLFRCEKATQPLPYKIKSLSPNLRDIFNKYSSIKSTKFPLTLSWDEIGKSNFNSDYTKIGDDIECFTEFVVKNTNEIIYEIDGSEESEGEIEKNKYPTIYHLILYIGELGNSKNGKCSSKVNQICL